MVILQASRLERWKGQAAHLTALGLMRDIPGWECWLAGGVQKAGEGEFLDELRRAANRAGSRTGCNSWVSGPTSRG